MLSPEVKELLLKASRKAVTARAEGRRMVMPDSQELDELYGRYRLLSERRGAFVTLKKRISAGAEPALRGCIGTMQGTSALYEEVIRLAVEAAFHDPRFNGVRPEELASIVFEISVLTPMKAVSSYHDISIGTDGILLSCSGRHAVFLPQVPTEQGWDLETTLTHLSLKAGLDQDAWRDASSSFQVFQAEVFSEGEELKT